MKMNLISLYIIIFLNIFGSVEDKFNKYFDSEVEFQVLKEYRNIFAESIPLRCSRIQRNEYLEFVGVYSGSSWDEILGNLEKYFEEKGSIIEESSDIKVIIFTDRDEKVMVKYFEEKVFIKYLKITTNKSP